MHFEILVEDQSGKKTLDILIPKIIGEAHSFRTHAYKGIGRIPRNMKDPNDPSKRILLENLPKLLRGYGKTFCGYGTQYSAAVIVVCDLDQNCLKIFRQELLRILHACDPKPETRFCFAIEEGEAWFLGDLNAVKTAYPNARDEILNIYRNDSICGTWEKLADAIYSGGSSALRGKGWQTVGMEKSKWAENITPYMQISRNRSPSFCYFRNTMQQLAAVPSILKT